MTGRVLVTGISGFLGGHVALALLGAGYAVRGSVRDPARAEGVRASLGRAGGAVERLEFVTLDLLEDAGWAAAATGCRYLQHVASPFVIEAPRDREVLIRPAVDGTRRAVGAALAAGVERIVVTSSVAAVTYGQPRRRQAPFTAADWTRIAGADVTAYAESKTRAEQEAWSLAAAAGRRDDLVAVNPAVVFGPLLDADPGTSPQLVRRLLDGSVPALPRIHLGIIDVRDVAELQVRAMADPDAGGRRYLAAAGTRSLLELAQGLRAAFPERARRIPRLQLPDWAMRVYARFDRLAADNVHALGVRHELDCGPARALLGHAFIAPEAAAAATARSLLGQGVP